MRHDLVIEGKTVQFTDKELLGQGGEGAVFDHGKYAVKVYHDQSRFDPRKVEELALLQSENIIAPIHLAYDRGGRVAGYAMRKLQGGEELCLFFTKTHKKERAIGPKRTIEIVMNLYRCVEEVHRHPGYLIVDLNEMNAMVTSQTKVVLIDADSFKTPSFPQTAIMESIRDPQTLGGGFTQESDWYSWAILAFQTYIHRHPFRGRHPDYKANQWRDRMAAGISDFNPIVKFPTTCNPLTSIPKAQRVWMEGVFTNKERSKPPMADATQAQAVRPAVVLNAAKNFTVDLERACNYDVGGIYSKFQHLVTVSQGEFAMFTQNHKAVTFERWDLPGQRKFGRGFARHGNFYGLNDPSQRLGKLQEYQLREYDGNQKFSVGSLTGVNAKGAKFFDGFLVHYPLGKAWLVNVFEEGSCTNQARPELDGFKILDGRADGDFIVLIAEKKGEYHRFIYHTTDGHRSYQHRSARISNYERVNMIAVKGMCLLVDRDKLLAFRDLSQVTSMDNPPFDADMQLVTHQDGVLFVNQNKVFKCRTQN